MLQDTVVAKAPSRNAVEDRLSGPAEGGDPFGTLLANLLAPNVRPLAARASDQSVEVSFRDLIGTLPADELTHAVHPYPARLLRQIPRYLLSQTALTEGIETVVDPFCGSGTVLLEARSAGFGSVGIDQNPLAALVARVKTQPIDEGLALKEGRALIARAKSTRNKWNPPDFAGRWYDAAALSVLGRLASEVRRSDLERGSQDYLNLCLALLARAAAQTDKRIPVPVRPKVKQTPGTTEQVWTLFEGIVGTLARRIGKLPVPGSSALVLCGDARAQSTWNAISSSPELILTSPPYGAAQKYVRSSSLELAWLGFCAENGTAKLERDSIGREHILLAEERSALEQPSRLTVVQQEVDRIAEVNRRRAAIYGTYFDDMDHFFARVQSRESVRKMVLVTGQNFVCGGITDTPGILAELASSRGFEPVISAQDRIRGRSLMTRRGGMAPASTYEQIEVFKRSKGT